MFSNLAKILFVPLLAAPPKCVLHLSPQKKLSNSLYLCSTFIMNVVNTSAISHLPEHPSYPGSLYNIVLAWSLTTVFLPRCRNGTAGHLRAGGD
jgi:hypothetical protein